jgi:hypothetical protein
MMNLQYSPALAVLVLDGCRWLLPQTEVASLEPLLDIDPEVRPPGSIGAIAYRDAWWPVYCLSGELRILARMPDRRRVCLLLNNGADQFGLIADQAEVLAEPPPLFPLPACMRLPDSPIKALALFDTGLGYTTSAEHIARLIATGEHCDV